VGSMPAMDQLTVRRCTVADLAQSPEFGALAAEYEAEGKRADIGPCRLQMDVYSKLELAGIMKFAGAWASGELVGLVSVGGAKVPHYDKPIATTESYFVRPHARKSGAGKLLLDQAEDMALEFGASGLFVSAPTGGRLAVVLPRTGYQQTNEVFFKRLA
jgi:GNAT superfamily N-acetyltransferase